MRRLTSGLPWKAGLVAAVLVAAPMPVSAQGNLQGACRITEKADNATLFDPAARQLINLGQVLRFGDLRVRATAEIDKHLVVDVKAPGFDQRNIHLKHGTPMAMRVCGQEVMVTMEFYTVNSYVLLVSVF